MYLGGIILFLSIPLALGSLWAFVPGGLLVLLLILRTYLEDRTLRRELEGYDAYAKRVRYRLVPGIWYSEVVRRPEHTDATSAWDFSASHLSTSAQARILWLT